MRSSGTSCRQFLQATGLALAAPTVIASSALGAADRPSAANRIVMGTIGCGGQGTGDMNGFLGFPEVQMVAVCDPVTSHREHARHDVNAHYRTSDCKTYNDFRERAGPARHRRRADRHARPLARHRHDRGLQARQGRVLREARVPDDPRGPGHGRGGATLRAGLLRRQPARAGRLRRLAPAAVGRGHRADHGGVRGLRRALRRLLLAPAARPAGAGLGPVAGPGPLAALPRDADPRRIPRLSRLLGRRHDRLGRPPLRRRHVRLRRLRDGPGRGHPARRQGRQAAHLPFRQRPGDVPRRHRAISLTRAPRARCPASIACRRAGWICPVTRARGAFSATSCTASARAKSPSATSRSPTAPRPSATWATSPTGSSGPCTGTRWPRPSSAIRSPRDGWIGPSAAPWTL